jgi:transposase
MGAKIELLFDKFHKELHEEKSIQKYDTTMVAVSSKLVEWGMKIGSKTDKKQVKFTMGMHGSLPCYFKIYTGQKYLCEDLTIPDVIHDYRYNKSSIVTFDRGVQSRSTFAGLSKSNILFVTRIKTSATYKILKSNVLPSAKKSRSVLLTEDFEVNFIEHSTNKPIPVPMRFIRGNIKETKGEICFVTNNFELDAYEIAALYRKRWEIEVFF